MCADVGERSNSKMPFSLPHTPKLMISSRDGMTSLASPEWKNNNYNLFAHGGKIEKLRIEICESLYLERLTMQQGALRTLGTIADDCLCLTQFIFTKGSVNGVNGCYELYSAAYHHSRQDLIASENTQITSIIFGREAVKQNFTNSALARMEGGHRRLGSDSLIRNPCDHGEHLFEVIDQYILAVTHSGRQDEVKPLTHSFISEVQPASSALVECIVTSDPIKMDHGVMTRRDLALEVERILWSSQGNVSDDAKLETMAKQLDVSVRYIQLAIKEHFGVSYSMLVRIIRLHQARASLRIKTRYKKISEIAAEHGFLHFGRFSQYYKRLFGVSPRQTDQC